MRNIGIQWIRKANVDNFTSDYGIVLRRLIGRPFRFILRCASKRKIIMESYPELEKGVPYIFASTHSFSEDIVSGLGGLDRNAYLLNGSTEQIKHNPQMYAAWLNGTIYLDRQDNESRHSSLEKMERVIRAGTSVFMFSEGGWNNSENLLCNPLFAGAYLVAQKTGAKIVPICTFSEHGGNEIYFNASNPIDASNRGKEEVVQEIRDAMATMVYIAMEKHTKPLKRGELRKDMREQFMRERRLEYMTGGVWTEDVWEEELTIYRDKRYPTPEQIRSTLKDVKITKNNAYIMAPVLVQLEEDEKYDFKRFMHQNPTNR